MAAMMQYLDEMEIRFCVKANRLGRHRVLRRFFSAVSRLGDGGFWLASSVVVVAVNGLQSSSAIVTMGATAGIGIVIYKLLKNRLVRERPYIASGDIVVGTAALDRYSFPSGHTLHAVSFTIMLNHVEPLTTVLCAPFALLVALSRVVLGLHYPSDVLVGALIGATLGSLSVVWM